MTKKERREAAQKKTKQQKIIIISVLLASAAIIAAVMIIFAPIRDDARDDARVYQLRDNILGNLTVTLYEDDSFQAELAHDFIISGTYTETENGGVTTVTFFVTDPAHTASTTIENDILILPFEWRAGCAHGHGFELPLR